MGNKLTERNDRLRHQRTKWRRQVEIVEGYWTDCADEDRAEMRSELRQQVSVLDADIEASNVDDFTKADLRMRLGRLMKQMADTET
ncbi:hypothetical protein AWB74_08268 [Caballeronia arvi]|uniref:Uncharacterized protein n=1 Tax=Caballeronia arvi TaxID=1777135 RepID=A0A158L346_9BURK|nr:hypothetical protein [Caballeronia arvi]SAL87796.1 hypothetical protein AWB74_08268 [Caballeronia arvi]